MDIKLEFVQNGFFETYILPILTTMIGAVFGGIITLLVNSYNNKKVVKADLRIKMWMDIVNNINAIIKLLIDINVYITNYKSGDSWDKVIEEINTKIFAIRDEVYSITVKINNNLLVASDLYNCTEKITNQVNEIPRYLNDLKEEKHFEILQLHISTLNCVFNELNLNLRIKLFKGLYSNRELNKNAKNLKLNNK